MLSSRTFRASAALPIVTALALAGCAGSTASQTALPASPLARAAAASPAAGASLVYGGTIQLTGTNGKATYKVKQTVVTSQTTYRGRPVTQYHGVETETGNGSSVQTTFDAYVATIASEIRTGTDVTLVKRASSSSAGVSQTTVYGAGNGVIDRLPEVPQARWSNTAARTVSIVNAAAGSSIDDTYHADGSYVENAVPVEGRTASAQSYPDGNAAYQFPYQGGSQNSTISFSPPAGGKLQVLFTNFLLHLTQLYLFDNWYPSSPPPLYSNLFRNAGTVALPSACNVPKRYGTTATQIVEQSARLDIVFGDYETTQRTAYNVAPYGLVCFVLHDELKTYYDYDAGALGGTPLTTQVTDETLSLQHAEVPNGSTVAATSVALPLDAGVGSMQAAARLKAERAIFHALQHLRKKS